MRNFILTGWLIFTSSMFSMAQQEIKSVKISDELYLIPLTPLLYQHVSEFTLESGEKVKCNGVLFIQGGEAIICDTPASEESSKQLLEWMTETHPTVKIVGVIVNHFHGDCVIGLREFHRAGIKSYSHQLTPELLKKSNSKHDIPQNQFTGVLSIKVGNTRVVNYHPGHAHSPDNIVTWIPSEKAIFGGCMVKSMAAEKGNLSDANVVAWPTTIGNVSSKYPEAKIIVPGHGDAGGRELLDYTIKLFQK